MKKYEKQYCYNHRRRIKCVSNTSTRMLTNDMRQVGLDF